MDKILKALLFRGQFEVILAIALCRVLQNYEKFVSQSACGVWGINLNLKND
ncbi:hypothetical protein ACKFKF_21235 [Phormidesmis sp. 146-12]